MRGRSSINTENTPLRQNLWIIPASAGTSLEFIARVTSHIPDKGQVMVRYYGLYANAHREPAPAKAGER